MPARGQSHTEETKRAMSLARRGERRVFTPAGIAALSAQASENWSRPDVCLKKSRNIGTPFVYTVHGEDDSPAEFDTLKLVADHYGITVGAINGWLRNGKCERREVFGEELEEWRRRKRERLDMTAWARM